MENGMLLKKEVIQFYQTFLYSGKITVSFFCKEGVYLRHSPGKIKRAPSTGIIPRAAFWVAGGAPGCPGAGAVGPGIYITRLMEPAMLQEAVTSMVSPGTGRRGYVYVNVSGAGWLV
jgi:hypothetical protein